MSKRSKRLQLVLDLAERKKKQADQFLAASRQRVEQDKRTMGQLDQYLAEYHQNYLGVNAEGCTGAQLHAQQAFMQKIQDAKDTQTNAMAQNLKELEAVEQHWKTSYARMKGMQKLTDKALETEMQAEEKALQKQIDERAQVMKNSFL
ncbi:flagellar export protein FliJ [Neptuniibacter sp. 1_MG-2023]|uniref:flagellar export protein FliJ n=1 Tax=Neptuniibacter sp. 1_MG-2023 TaxID=3062662 RepID=UPI0026E180F9|nr:flagellar export protein FliJ [Neptuniibacter sp. 1_MG-2023]MDO6594746.1 flagellar export protein FliJ [Neptuniibacter sp. 1_MG-2023]